MNNKFIKNKFMKKSRILIENRVLQEDIKVTKKSRKFFFRDC